MYYIGIDIGTTAVKMIAMDEMGVVKASVNRSYPISYPHLLWSEQNPGDWWDRTMDGMTELLSTIEKDQVASISFSGQMHGLVTLDEKDEVIRPAILWNDQRTEEECAYLNSVVGLEKLSKYTGNMALTGFTAPKILWMQKHESDGFKRISKIMLPKDYIAYKMTGVFATDMSDASGTLYLDVEHKTWSKEMLEILNITEEMLPKLYESYDVIGTLKSEVADALGLKKDVKVVMGGGDQAVAAIGGGVVSENDCSVSLGTSGVVFASNNAFYKDAECRLHSFCHSTGRYHLMGVTLAAASSLKWWVEEVHKSTDYDGILQEAKEASLENGIFYLPYLMGERTPHNDPHCTGSFIGLRINHQRGDMTRAILEGVAFSLRDTFEIMKQMGVEINQISINGGGATSRLWCQIIADVLNVRVNKIADNEGPAYGAAILAAVGSKQFSSVEDACSQLIQVTESIEPNGDWVEVYDKKYEVFKRIYPVLNEI